MLDDGEGDRKDACGIGEGRKFDADDWDGFGEVRGTSGLALELELKEESIEAWGDKGNGSE